MRQINPFMEKKYEGFCVFCGSEPNTRDHIPSKILLEKPFPENLMVVPACEECNQDFSLDEEYFACIIECVLSGTTEVEKIKRKKIRDILKRKPKLLRRISNSKKVIDDRVTFEIEKKRIEKVVLKLARGHAIFEIDEICLEFPESIWFKPIEFLSKTEYENFFSEKILKSDYYPEIGNRLFFRVVEDEIFKDDNWINVQEGNYRYYVDSNLGGFLVRIIIWNYLACEVFWKEK